jgi:prophage maintenance system killer protein
MRNSYKHKTGSATGGEIVIYRAKDGRAIFDVQLQQETIWLNLNQIAILFKRDKSVISRHLRDIYITGELERGPTVAKNATVQNEGGRKVIRQVEYYSLDAIISVGYRVNSKRGTEFRIWATQVLKDHLIKGYTLNEQRLKGQVNRLRELQGAVDLMGRVLSARAVTGPEAEGLLKVISDYSLALRLLDEYDHQRLRLHATMGTGRFIMTYEAAMRAIGKMAEGMDRKDGALFGREKDKGLASALGAVYQTFDGRDLYPSVEEKAAHVLYFVVKNHAFVDGNKRIGAFLFIWFLDANGLLYRNDTTKRLADNALVALTLLIAESKPAEKDIICTVIVNLINRDNL